MKFHKDGTSPINGEIFVFGSNLAGRHGAGAAKLAYQKFGAIYGQATGLQGNSFAIPTKDQILKPLDLKSIKFYVDDFLIFTQVYPEKEFWVTAIGCGLAGNSHSEIAPMFKKSGENISLPDCFLGFLKDEDE